MMKLQIHTKKSGFRVAVVVVLALVLALPLWGQTSGDVRVRGMAGAYTGLADDANSLFLNPAGLGYLDHSSLVIGAGADFELTKRVLSDQGDLPYVYEDYSSWNPDAPMEYVYWDDFLNATVPFDPADYGFPYDPEDPESKKQAIQDYMTYQETYEFYNFAQGTSYLTMIPRVTYAEKGFGVSTISEFSMDFLTEDTYSGPETPLGVSVVRKLGVVGGLGFNLGPVALGANVKYYNRGLFTLDYTAEDFQYGPPEDLFKFLFMGVPEGEETTNHFELGIGALFTLGKLSAGAYLDNLLFFLDPEGTGVDAKGIFETLSVGVSWTPTNSKHDEDWNFLNLALAGDLKNIGSQTKRQLNAGIEVGFNIARVLTSHLRLGYTQNLPGTLGEAFGAFSPWEGEYTVGFGGRLLFGEINMAATFPADVVLMPPSGSLTDEEKKQLFTTMQVEVLFRL
ncbi:PorV/PorQ family protein [Spirochaeta lutea]|uniref:DUF5723 domain-containing protein n=1 Tax=Spirochaeta lutea TaxID=1480694 RepID=A0A098QX89_9SPIO|nr:hypothetical protein [Spirochaeta lutea]KGE71102.1 hypothetical protein DC28_12685 [Spirochaeta lutea]